MLQLSSLDKAAHDDALVSVKEFTKQFNIR